ncbi:MAG: TonB-dependent receptor, partial [Pseudomonadota bacterium]
FQNRGELDRFADDEILEIAANAEFDADLFRIKVGGQFRDQEKEEGFTFTRFVVDPNSGLNYTLADAVDTALTDVEFQGNYDFLFRVDSDGANQFFADNAAGFAEAFTVNNGSSASEEVYAGYVQGTFDFPRGSVTGGVRVEHTSWEGGPEGGDDVSGDYTNVLPSAVAQYEVYEDVLVRVAASRTIGRPNISDLTNGFSINTSEAGQVTVSRSNPNLDPRISTNVDVSVEWYIPDGLFAVGAFYKDIQDEIFTVTTDFAGADRPIINGAPVDTLTQPQNASSAEIFGLEAQYQQVMSFLPAPWNGLGVAANVTWLDTEFDVIRSDGSTDTLGLFQQPDLTYNAVVFYANEFFETRLSWNWTGEFLDTVGNTPDQDEFWDDRGQLDAQIRVNASENLSLVFEAVNLNDAGRTEVSGPNGDFLQEDARFGRTFWIGANVAF